VPIKKIKKQNGQNKYLLLSNKVTAISFALAFALTGCSSSGVTERMSESVYELMDKDNNTAFEKDAQNNSDNNQENMVGSDNVLAKDTIETIEDEYNSQNQESNGEIKVYDTSGDLLETKISVIDEEEQPYSDGNEIRAYDLLNSQNPDLNKHNNRYAYSKLTDRQKETYEEIYAVLNSMSENVVLTSKDMKEIDLTFKAVMVDYPELFYVKGYSVGKYMFGDTIDRISISGTYTMSKGDVLEKKNEIEDYVTNVIYNAPLSDDYEKIKYVYEYLVKNNEYVEGAPNNQNILSVVEGGQTVCQGYAKMTQLLLNRMGIFCTLVNGTAIGNVGSGSATWGSHVWNITLCNGSYYNLDTTWGDASFTLVGDGGESSPVIDINYEFLLVDDNELQGTHRPDPVVEMPKCTSLSDNYYIHEGYYFYDVDSNQISKAFDGAYARGEKIVFLKADNGAVLDKLKQFLITDQHVFDYLHEDSVRYVVYSGRNLIMVAL